MTGVQTCALPISIGVGGEGAAPLGADGLVDAKQPLLSRHGLVHDGDVVEGGRVLLQLLEVGGHTVLLDCGQIQGSRLDEELNRVPLPVGRVDAVVLSHAHIDHSGRLPLLRKQGFRYRRVSALLRISILIWTTAMIILFVNYTTVPMFFITFGGLIAFVGPILLLCGALEEAADIKLDKARFLISQDQDTLLGVVYPRKNHK